VKTDVKRYENRCVKERYENLKEDVKENVKEDVKTTCEREM
jgi:hypothetical protein